MVVCLEQGADLHMAQLMPLPLTVSCFSKIQIGFTFLVPNHLGSPRKGPLNGCVCVSITIIVKNADFQRCQRPRLFVHCIKRNKSQQTSECSQTGTKCTQQTAGDRATLSGDCRRSPRSSLFVRACRLPRVASFLQQLIWLHRSVEQNENTRRRPLAIVS